MAFQEFQYHNSYQNAYKELYPTNINRPMCYFDIEINGFLEGRIIFELFSDICPKTCENFQTFCRGRQHERTYYQTPFHKIIPNFAAIGGDVTRGDGRGGISIYGPIFEDENFIAKHKMEGLLSMVNKGPNTNNSQFMITLYPLPWLDGKHVVFGRVMKGYEVVRKIEECGSELGRPKKRVIIADCGEITNTYGLKNEY